jgi:glycosyltransferase involved in cell wall biosynthesis
MRVIAVIPAFNEAPRIGTTLADIVPMVDGVVVVVDAAQDGTVAEARKHPVYVLAHALNRGQGAALQTGTEYALEHLKADIIVHFDADGQMRASDIPAMIAPLKEGKVHVVLGSRFLGQVEGMPFARRLAYAPARLFTFALTGLWLTDVHNGFRAFTAPAARRLRITLDRMAHASEILDLLAASGLPYQEVPVSLRYSEETLAKSRADVGTFARRAVRVVTDVLKKRFV